MRVDPSKKMQNHSFKVDHESAGDRVMIRLPKVPKKGEKLPPINFSAKLVEKKDKISDMIFGKKSA